MRTAGHFVWEVRAARGSLRLGQVLGAIFLLAATAWLKPIVSYVYDAVRMSDWDQTTATVLAVEFDPEPEPDDHAPPLRVRYRYRHGNASYEGNRADIARRHVVQGDFQHGLLKRFRQAIHHAHLSFDGFQSDDGFCVRLRTLGEMQV